MERFVRVKRGRVWKSGNLWWARARLYDLIRCPPAVPGDRCKVVGPFNGYDEACAWVERHAAGCAAARVSGRFDAIELKGVA